ncbi:hypothetical protein ACIP98_29015 [Streptomyces sp. NPDC088354]|uniref:hypothetical protein n=1 Tax=Streptomyces sp. NPDC088354 TaxID=3365856 RepID=UPI00380000F0
MDAVRREAQRQAYAELYRTARDFIDLYGVDVIARLQSPPGDEARAHEMHAAQDALLHAADMVVLEGPEQFGGRR